MATRAKRQRPPSLGPGVKGASTHKEAARGKVRAKTTFPLKPRKSVRHQLDSSASHSLLAGGLWPDPSGAVPPGWPCHAVGAIPGLPAPRGSGDPAPPMPGRTVTSTVRPEQSPSPRRGVSRFLGVCPPTRRARATALGPPQLAPSPLLSFPEGEASRAPQVPASAGCCACPLLLCL